LGEIGKNFPVKFNISFFQTGDESAVGKIVLSSGGADLNLPKPSVKTFFLASVIELKFPCVKQGFFRLTVFRASGPHKTLRVFQQIFPAFISLGSSFDSGHGGLFNRPIIRQNLIHFLGVGSGKRFRFPFLTALTAAVFGVEMINGNTPPADFAGGRNFVSFSG